MTWIYLLENYPLIKNRIKTVSPCIQNFSAAVQTHCPKQNRTEYPDGRKGMSIYTQTNSVRHIKIITNDTIKVIAVSFDLRHQKSTQLKDTSFGCA